uniref:Uncharacterized protein n=1 Tax=Chromera velia CCMP2878 TaxID=1169474 RepID=A0A0G4HAV9_9ALVE|eukprot:Cvel_25650.t1-p1 / transcript=Cvel_25650.t1 / gene=Cvel_25650 / organism=Chromera_velia_CCMP2878 / gene_product=hypothetical protein / transcript_product=hypothetical protein / location=Cvel_scaffold2935:15659-16210(-) / protein_length=184 / sequence_SO=supercontig / SO=protein_coding / is_pseudo=false
MVDFARMTFSKAGGPGSVFVLENAASRAEHQQIVLCNWDQFRKLLALGLQCLYTLMAECGYDPDRLKKAFRKILSRLPPDPFLPQYGVAGHSNVHVRPDPQVLMFLNPLEAALAALQTGERCLGGQDGIPGTASQPVEIEGSDVEMSAVQPSGKRRRPYEGAKSVPGLGTLAQLQQQPQQQKQQ